MSALDPLSLSHGHQLRNCRRLLGKLQRARRREVFFNTTLPRVFKEPLMSCKRGRVIIVWIPESDVRGKGKLANSQTRRAEVRRHLAGDPLCLKDFPYTLFLALSLKSIKAPLRPNGLHGQDAASFWHIFDLS